MNTRLLALPLASLTLVALSGCPSTKDPDKSDKPKRQIRIALPTVDRLDAGAPVVIRGVPVAKVSSVRVVQDRVEITASVLDDQDPRLGADTCAAVLNRKVIINPGKEGSEPDVIGSCLDGQGWTVALPNALGLTKGDVVRVRGVDVGTIVGVVLSETGVEIEAIAMHHELPPLGADACATVRFGEINVDPGSPGSAPPPAIPLCPEPASPAEGDDAEQGSAAAG